MLPETWRNVVGLFILGLALGIVAGLFLLPIPAGNAEVALVVLGVAIGWAGNVVQFHFGTSEGSKSKTALMSKDGQ